MKRRSFFAATAGLILSAVLPVKKGYSYVMMRGRAFRPGPIPNVENEFQVYWDSGVDWEGFLRRWPNVDY